MDKSFSDGFFSFLVGNTLSEVARVAVTVPDGTWVLSNSLLIRIQSKGLLQVIVELDSQEVLHLDNGQDVDIRGDYDDLIDWHVEPTLLPGLVLPDKVVSVVEFQSLAGKVVGAEIQLTRSAFAVLLYPEDVDLRRPGEIWDFVREHGLVDMHKLLVMRLG